VGDVASVFLFSVSVAWVSASAHTEILSASWADLTLYDLVVCFPNNAFLILADRI
jgi:hypothetical protein